MWERAGNLERGTHRRQASPMSLWAKYNIRHGDSIEHKRICTQVPFHCGAPVQHYGVLYRIRPARHGAVPCMPVAQPPSDPSVL